MVRTMEMTMKQARDRFGALVDEARRHGPVVVTKHGRPVATVMDYEAWQRMVELAEEAVDARAYDEAMAEGGESVSLEEIKAELGL